MKILKKIMILIINNRIILKLISKIKIKNKFKKMNKNKMKVV